MTDQSGIQTIATEIVSRINDYDYTSGGPDKKFVTMADIFGKSENVITDAFAEQLMFWDYISDPEVIDSGAIVMLSFGQLLEQGRSMDEVVYEMATYALPGDCIHVITNGLIIQEVNRILDQHDEEIFTDDQFSILEDALRNPDDESLAAIDNGLALRLVIRTIFSVDEESLPFDFGAVYPEDAEVIDIPQAPGYEPEF